MHAKNPECVLLSRTDSIGDVTLTLPVAGILKKHLPACRIAFLASSYTRPLLEACTHVDEVIEWDILRREKEEVIIARLRALRADAILHIFPEKEIARLAKKAGIPMRVGTSHRLYHLSTCNRLLHFSRKNSALHEAQLNLKLLAPLGIVPDFSLEEICGYAGLTKNNPPEEKILLLPDPARINLVLHPKSKGSAREWGLENFAALARLLPEEKYKLFVTGTAAEGDAMQMLFQEVPQLINLCGQLSLSGLITFLRATDGIVAASTGPLHIAAILGKKAVGIYAPMRPIHPGRWAPLGKYAAALSLDKKCNACLHSTDCACIKSITPLQVKQKLDTLFTGYRCS